MHVEHVYHAVAHAPEQKERTDQQKDEGVILALNCPKPACGFDIGWIGIDWRRRGRGSNGMNSGFKHGSRQQQNGQDFEAVRVQRQNALNVAGTAEAADERNKARQTAVGPRNMIGKSHFESWCDL